MQNMRLTTIKELETPIKMTRFLYLSDILFIFGYVFITYQAMEKHIYTKFTKLYLINCFLWGIFLICPAVGNHKRKNWQNILNTLVNMNSRRFYKGPGKEFCDDDIR